MSPFFNSGALGKDGSLGYYNTMFLYNSLYLYLLCINFISNILLLIVCWTLSNFPEMIKSQKFCWANLINLDCNIAKRCLLN